MPGLTTLIIISSLLCVVAVWTWAIDAEASGLSSKDLNSSPTLEPRFFSIIDLDSFSENGGQVS